MLLLREVFYKLVSHILHHLLLIQEWVRVSIVHRRVIFIYWSSVDNVRVEDENGHSLGLAIYIQFMPQLDHEASRNI
jgi:hypothetical protein